MSNVIGIVGIVVGVVGVVASFLFFYWQRQLKGLGVAVVTNRSLIDPPAHLPIIVRYEDRSVAAPRLVVFRLANTGNAEIRAEDFERPLKVIFPDCEILSASQTSARPDSFRPIATFEDLGVLKLEPTLLNPGDIVEYQCILDGELSSADVIVDGRIAGVRDPGLVWDYSELFSTGRWWAGPWAALGLFVVVISGLAIRNEEYRSGPVVVYFLLGAAGLVMVGLSVLIRREVLRARRLRDPAS